MASDQGASLALDRWQAWNSVFAGETTGYPLDAGVALFYARCGSIDGSLLQSYRSLLSDEERQRNQRYRFERDRDRDMLARALTRCVLAGFLSCSPEQLVFERGKHGKPGLAAEKMPGVADVGSLAFNLSHAGDWVVLNGWGVGEAHYGGYAQLARVSGDWLVPLP